MSWSFSQTNATPSDVKKRADEYFGQPYIGTMHHPERVIAQLAHAQILLAADRMRPGFLMNVSAYGSQSTSDDGALNSLSVSISYVAAPAEAASG